MKQEIVLPKFKLPGQKPNWAMRALWIVGGLVGVQALVLGIALWKRQADQQTALAALEAQRAQMAVVATQEPKPAVNPGKLPGVSAAPVPAKAEPAKPAAVAAAEAPERVKKPTSTTKSRKASSSSAKNNRLLAKAMSGKGTATAKVETKKSDPKTDAIDDLLRRFR